VKGDEVLIGAVGRQWLNAAKRETHRWRRQRVTGGGLRVEEYQWTTGKLLEAAVWLEEYGGWPTTVNSVRKKTRLLNSIARLR
jgi:hypothetical protein